MAEMIQAVMSRLGSMLTEIAKEEVEKFLSVPYGIAKLQSTLLDISSIIADAERRRIRESSVELWLKELRDAMYEAEDILDEYKIVTAEENASSSMRMTKRQKLSAACTSILRNFNVYLGSAGAMHKIGRRLHDLNQRLEDIEVRSARFGFISNAVSSISTYNSQQIESSRRTAPGIVPSDVVGEKIEEDTRMIVDLLVNKVDSPEGSTRTNTGVIAISGTGGIGKTTLARMVFHDELVKANFKKRIWLSVNQDYDEIALLKSIISGLLGGRDQKLEKCLTLTRDKALLEDRLEHLVRQKKFLLVLDDVWNDKVWGELLRTPLSNSTPGSQVLVTTRKDEVAHRMNKRHLHHVQKLNREDAWSLLKKVVLMDADEAEVNGLQDIGMLIVERCDGLPLAVKVVGGLLLTKPRTRRAWMDVCSHPLWSTARVNDDINNVFYMSYEELPTNLKPCFLYCSMFPKNELIPRRHIVRLWIAEGFVQENLSSKLLEELGSEYYYELISRNLLTPQSGYYDQSASTMHDVVRSFAQYIAKDEGLLFNKEQSVTVAPDTTNLRRLSLSGKMVDSVAIQKLTSLRTLMLFRNTRVDLNDFLTSLSYLRVLHLFNTKIDVLPDAICHLKHLRYMGLEGAEISAIPHDIGNLKFLQHIDLQGCKNVTQLPNSILKLQGLRTLDIRGTSIATVQRGFGMLRNLINMSGFPTHSEGGTDEWCSLEELKFLSKLNMLIVERLEKANPSHHADKTLLRDKPNLTVLELRCTSRLGADGKVKENIRKEEQESIKQVFSCLCPPPCIESLTIAGYYGYQLQDWMAQIPCFKNLRRIEIEDYPCCKQLPHGLGQLPFLDYLWVERTPSIECINHDFLQPSFGGEGLGVAFPKLVTLGFSKMLEWSEWEWEEHIPSMPKLEKLYIWYCKLSRLPPGLAKHAVSLRTLGLRDLPHLVSVEKLPSVEVTRMRNIVKLERIANNPSLRHIIVINCPGLKVLEDLPALRSFRWEDLDANTLPQYLQEVKIIMLEIKCNLILFAKISLQDATNEWEKIKHIEQVKVYGDKRLDGTYKSYMYLSKGQVISTKTEESDICAV